MTATIMATATLKIVSKLFILFSFNVLVEEVGFEPTSPEEMDLQSIVTRHRYRSSCYCISKSWFL